jgi:membrane-associated phospholipid phosphatase
MPGPAPYDHHEAQSRPDGVPRDARTRLLVLPQLRGWVLSGMLLCAAVVALGLTTQLVPGLGTAELALDQDLSHHHSVVLTIVAMTLNYVFAPLAGGAIIFAVCLYLWLVRGALVSAAAFGLVASSGWVSSEFFKILIARHRPDPSVLFDPLSPETGSDSFPSGHVAFAVALAVAVYFLARGTQWAKPAATAGAVLAVTVAWSRLYIGVHYASDVVASFLAAGAAVILLTGLWNRYARRIFDRFPGAATTHTAATLRK